MAFTDACSVPISEIITVEEADTHGKHHSSGKWQKMEKPFAFTGDGAKSLPGLPWFHAVKGQLFCHLFDKLIVSFFFLLEIALCNFFQDRLFN